MSRDEEKDLRRSCRLYWPIDEVKAYAVLRHNSPSITFQTQIRTGANCVYGEGETIAESELAAKKTFEDTVRTWAREVESWNEQKEEE